MNPQELYRAGRLTDAIKALSAELRDNPTDAQAPNFPFRAALLRRGIRPRGQATGSVGASRARKAKLGVLLYRSALFAERQRQDLFEQGEFPPKRMTTNRSAAA